MRTQIFKNRIAIWMLLFGSLMVLPVIVVLIQGKPNKAINYIIEFIIGTAMVLWGWKHCGLDRIRDVTKSVIAALMLPLGLFLVVLGAYDLILPHAHSPGPMSSVITLILGTVMTIGAWKLSSSARNWLPEPR